MTVVDGEIVVVDASVDSGLTVVLVVVVGVCGRRVSLFDDAVIVDTSVDNGLAVVMVVEVGMCGRRETVVDDREEVVDTSVEDGLSVVTVVKFGMCGRRVDDKVVVRASVEASVVGVKGRPMSYGGGVCLEGDEPP